MAEKLTWWQGLLVVSTMTTAGLAIWSVIEAKRAVQSAVASLETSPADRVSGPLISVIIPTWNEAEYLPRLLTSLANQTYQPLEIIVADWNSTDGTREVAASYGAMVVNVPERGVGPARNAGAAAAAADLLLFLDADVILEPTLVEQLMAQLLERHAELVHPGIVTYEDGLIQVVSQLWRTFMPSDYTTRVVLVTRRAFEAVGGYKNIWREDLDFGKRVKEAFGGSSIIYLLPAVCGHSTRRTRALWAGRVETVRAPEFPAVRDHVYL